MPLKAQSPEKKDRQFTVSVAILHLLSRFVKDKEIDFNGLCAESGISTSVFDDPENRISADRFWTVWDKTAQITGNRNFGLHFGQELSNNYLGGNILMGMMANSPTIRDALTIFCRYHNLMEDVIQPKLRVERKSACLSWQLMTGGAAIPRHNAEALLCAAMLMLRYISDNRITPTAVFFGHPKPQNIKEHEKIFNTALHFDHSVNELVFDREILDMPIFLASSELCEVLEQLAGNRLNKIYASGLWSEKVNQTIRTLLSHGERVDIKTVAVAQAVSVRNLQNKLRAEQTTFTEILEQLRKAIAMDYLKQPGITICDVAFLLGFSEQSAFNHAFKRWTGSTPMEYRKKYKKKFSF